MRVHSFLLLAIAVAAGFAGDAASAQTEATPAEIAAARRDLEAAKIEARHYWQVDYLCDKRELDAAIRVSDEEVRTMRRSLRTFGPFNPFAYGQLPNFEYRNARLCLADAQARRQLLIDQRNDLNRTHADQLALLQLNVDAARARLVELEGGGVIELDVVKTADAGSQEISGQTVGR